MPGDSKSLQEAVKAATLDTGAALSTAFQAVTANSASFLVLAGLSQAPTIAWQYWIMSTAAHKSPEETAASPEGAMGMFAAGLLATFLSALLTQVATGAMVFGVFQHLRGQRATFAECIGTGLRRVLDVIITGIFVGLIVGVGFVFCCVPGFIAQAALFAAVSCAVIERKGAIESIRRSTSLTAGNRWRVFFIALGLGVLQIGLSLAVSPLSALSWIAWLVGYAALLTVGTALQASAQSVVYFRLREIKETVLDLDAIAAVFD